MIDNPEALLTEEACDEGFVYETKPFNVLEAHSSQSIEAELRSKFDLSSEDLQQLLWLDVKIKPLSLHHQGCEADVKFIFELVSGYGKVKKVLKKPAPYQDSCFVQMSCLLEAALVRRSLCNKVVGQFKVQTSFFGSPKLQQKITTKPPLTSNQQVSECVVPRCLSAYQSHGLIISEMNFHLLKEDRLLGEQYDEYLNLCQPDQQLGYIKSKKLSAMFIVPRYCKYFEFTSLFIGRAGKYTKLIKQQCKVNIDVNVYESIVILVSAEDVEQFLKGVRLCQDRLVEVMEIYMQKMRKCCAGENRRAMFVQPFYSKRTRHAVEAFFAIRASNQAQLAEYFVN